MISPRVDISVWTVILAEWIYFGIDDFHHGRWSGVGLAAFMISFCWRRIIETWDEARNGNDF